MTILNIISLQYHLEINVSVKRGLIHVLAFLMHIRGGVVVL